MNNGGGTDYVSGGKGCMDGDTRRKTVTTAIAKTIKYLN